MKGWRKLAVVVLTVVLSFVLAVMDKLTGEFVTVATVAIGAYTASNAYVHHVQNKQ